MPARRPRPTLAGFAALAVAAAAGASPARAQDARDERQRRADRAAVAVRLPSPVTIDGRLDEPAWQAARFFDDLAQKEPTQDAPPTERTELAIAFDDDALYVAARMHVADPARLERPLTRRDDTSGAERIIVSLDPYRTRRLAYSFAVTAAGVRADWIHTDDSEYQRDGSWNPVWEAAVAHAPAAWTAELRIPLSQLRFPEEPEPVWGVNINRYVPRRREDVFWVVVPKDRTGWASYFGRLTGLAGLAPTPRLEVLPYLSGAVTARSSALVDPDDPFARRVAPGGNAGVDLKLGLGPSLTLDATVNPDFGQVEADPAVVNLSAFEVTFPERRPFFVEGAPIFQSSGRSYFYSRRIGAPPRLAAGAAYAAPAEAARILGAAKLTGALRPRTSVGALAAVTAPVRVDTADAAGARGVETLAPLAGWGVLRLEHQLDDDASLAGFTLASVTRRLDEPALAAALPRTAVTGGVDARLRLAGGAWEVFAAAGGSLVTGEPAAITALQRASARWFQRPDAGHVEVDPTATSLAGWHADARAARRAGDWRVEAGATAESPGFELNDLGVLQSADDLEAWAWLRRVETTPGRFLHAWSVSTYASAAWNFDGDARPGNHQLTADLTLPSFYRLSASTSLWRPGLSEDETRGGPLMEVGWRGSASVSVSDPGTGAVSWNARLSGEASPTESTGVSGGGSLLWRAADRLRLSVAPSASRETSRSQYVAALGDTGGGDATFGTRYVFATLDRREVSLALRAQLALTPDLTIDGYVEPFASSGSYRELGELPRPRARELRRYAAAAVTRGDGVLTVADGGDTFSLPDPDFTVLSLRSTVVLRWELRPGSVLYAVWQQARGQADPAARPLRGVADELFTAPAEHVLAIKLGYWWAP